MQNSRRKIGRLCIVRHHDYGLAVITIQNLQEFENLVGFFAIQITRWLVA